MVRIIAGCACAAICGLVVLAAAQTPTFRSRVDTVDVHATVRDSEGRLITTLTRDDFELYDNGKRREISVFSGDVQTIAISLLLDRSGSIADQSAKVLYAAESFVTELRPDDRAALHTLQNECQPLTADKPRLYSLLHDALPSDLGSPVWSGLERTLTSMTGEAGRRAVLLFSDGMDTGSPFVIPGPARGFLPAASATNRCRPWSGTVDVMFTDNVKRAQRDGVMVYAVSVEGARGMANDDDLKTIATRSGGDRYRLKDATELAAAFKRIAEELHHQYLLGFAPANYDGKVHELEVRVKRPNVSVRSRRSYVAMRLDGPVVPSSTTVMPVPPLAENEIARAIEAGSKGRRLDATCRAMATFRGDDVESAAYVEVLLEGPTGRIMRSAREAREARRPFDATNVTPDLRRSVVQITTELRYNRVEKFAPPENPAAPASGSNPPAGGSSTDPAGTNSANAPVSLAPTPLPPVTAPARPFRPVVRPTSMLLRSKTLTEYSLNPEYEVSNPLRFTMPPPATKLIGFVDLAGVRALPGDDLEVVVRGGAGLRSCTIPAKNRADIR